MITDKHAFITVAKIIHQQNPHWRWGQTVFEVAFQFWPKETERAKECADPFHLDTEVEKFIDNLWRIRKSCPDEGTWACGSCVYDSCNRD